MMAKSEKNSICVLLPTYFDTKSLKLLIPELLKKIDDFSYKFSVHKILIVDDSAGKDKDIKPLLRINKVEVITTNKNMGNQNAIIFGLDHALNNYRKISYFMVMDSDGEDSPEGIPVLLESILTTNCDLVLAKRGKRSDIDWQTRILLNLFKILFRILTGKFWIAGNFSIIKYSWMESNFEKIKESNSFASSLQALPAVRTTSIVDREKRIFGAGKINRKSKIIYAMDSLIPWISIIQIRSLIFFFINLLNFFICTLIAFVGRFIWGFATPNWFTIVVFSSLGLAFISLNIFLTTFTLRNLHISGAQK